MAAFFCCDFIILLIPEVGEGNNKKAKDSVQGVEGIVDNLEGVDNVGDVGIGGPILSPPKFGRGGGRHKGNVDWKQ